MPRMYNFHFLSNQHYVYEIYKPTQSINTIMKNTVLWLWCFSIAYLLFIYNALRPILASLVIYGILRMMKYSHKAWVALIALWVAFLVPIYYQSPTEGFDSLETIADEVSRIRRQLYTNEQKRMQTEEKIMNNQLLLAKQLNDSMK